MKIVVDRSTLVLLIAASVLMLVHISNSLGQTPARQPQVDMDEMRKAEEQLLSARRELIKTQAEILRVQANFLRERIERMREEPKTANVAQALAAILDLSAAELKLEQARLNSYQALQGSRLVAADGQYLGRIGPTYDLESIFCSFGEYGATYSQKSIWCTYGKYGATYQQLSPFCSYSTTPPKLLLDGVEVAAVSVSRSAGPIVISPESLRGIYAERVGLGSAIPP